MNFWFIIGENGFRILIPMIKSIQYTELKSQERFIHKIFPPKFRVRAVLDTSTLIRIFYGSRKSPEFKIYQNLFDIIITESVYKEYLNYQKGTPRSVQHKEHFLELLGAQVLNSGIFPVKIKDYDAQIVKEAIREQVEVIITDNVKDFQERIKGCNLDCMNGLKIASIFLEKKQTIF